MFKVASWNVNSLKVRLPHVLGWLEQVKPDVLGLQETKLIDENFPLAAIEEAGYQVSFAGQKTYNGVALLAKQPIAEVVTDLPDFNDPQRRVLAATVDGVRILNLYAPNGSSVGSEKYQYKLAWLQALQAYTKQQLAQYEQVVLMGDFNIAPEDRDVHDPAEWVGSVLVSEPERQALQNLLALGLSDTFRLQHEEAGEFSWWDYRQAAFRRNRGLRIDLILANQAMASRCQLADIDVTPRRLERPSDHAPVLAGFGRAVYSNRKMSLKQHLNRCHHDGPSVSLQC